MYLWRNFRLDATRVAVALRVVNTPCGKKRTTSTPTYDLRVEGGLVLTCQNWGENYVGGGGYTPTCNTAPGNTPARDTAQGDPLACWELRRGGRPDRGID